jgi:hypothetical protein
LQRPPKSLYQDAHKKEAQANRPSNNSAPVWIIPNATP